VKKTNHLKKGEFVNMGLEKKREGKSQLLGKKYWEKRGSRLKKKSGVPRGLGFNVKSRDWFQDPGR